MAFGNKNQQSNLTLYILKIKTRDENLKDCSPYFQLSHKVDGKWEVIEGRKETSVSGKLFKAEAKTGEWDGQPIQSANIYLKDGDEAYLLDFRYNILNKSIINGLLNVDDYDKEIEISLYTNKRGYAAATVRSGGDLVDWRYSLSELPQPTVVKYQGKDLRDFTEVDAFFHDKVKELAEKLNGHKGSDKSEEEDVDVAEQEAAPAADGATGDDEPLF